MTVTMKAQTASYYDGLPQVAYVDGPALGSSQKPDMSLDEASKAWFKAWDGSLHPVDSRGNSEDFERAVRNWISKIQSRAGREECLQAMRECDLAQLIDRWFLLNTLTEHGAIMPVFATRAEAMLNIGSRKVDREQEAVRIEQPTLFE